MSLEAEAETDTKTEADKKPCKSRVTVQSGGCIPTRRIPPHFFNRRDYTLCVGK
jgi:hypothetical protein